MKAEENVSEGEFADLCNCARTDGTHALDCAAVYVVVDDGGEGMDGLT